MRISVELPEFTREEVNIIATALNMTQQTGQQFFIDKMWWGQARQLCIAAIETSTPEFSIQGLKEYISSKLIKAFSTPGNTLVMQPGVNSLLHKLNLNPIHNNEQQKKELIKYAEELKQKYYDEFQMNKATLIQEYEDEYTRINTAKEQKLRALVADYKDKIAKIDEDLKKQLGNL